MEARPTNAELVARVERFVALARDLSSELAYGFVGVERHFGDGLRYRTERHAFRR